MASSADPIRVVIDCDPGRDDALGILVALGAPGLQVDFITTVAGNVSLERATSNALRILTVAGAGEIPVYAGASGPLARRLVPGSTMHGDMADSDPAMPPAIARVAGTSFEPLRAWCRERSPVRKRLIALGPLTNIATMLQDDPAGLAGVDDMFVMGGTVGHVATRVSPTAEFNFHSDPEAAQLVLNSGVPVYLYDYDVTTSCQIPVDEISRIGAAIGPPVGHYVDGWLLHLWEYANRIYGREGVAVHDMYAAIGATGVNPGRWEWHTMTVDCSDQAPGTIYATRSSVGTGIAVARDLDRDLMIRCLIECARNLPALQVN